jgi:hypothetical protein
LHRGPTANRFRGTNEGAESAPCQVLRRIHRPIEIRPVSRLSNFSQSDVSVFSVQAITADVISTALSAFPDTLIPITEQR